MCPREAIPVNKPTHVVRTNVFDALGFSPSEASTLNIKSELLSAILEEVKMKGYTLSRLTDVLDEYRPVVRNMLRGRVSLISIEKLLRYAHRMHLHTSIAVGPVDNGRRSSRSRRKQKTLRAARKLAQAV
jgi:predicted XRE-type DNA-binding protein